jgi:hypothetical protein
MMVWAVDSLEHPPLFQNDFLTKSGKSQEKQAAFAPHQEMTKAG